MTELTEVRLPDIGDFKDVDVIEVLVKPGDSIQAEDSVITLESDKATMEVPSPHSGLIKDVKVQVGDKVSQGTLILTMEAERTKAASAPQGQPAGPAARGPEAPPPPPPREPTGGRAEQPAERAPSKAAEADLHAEVLVLGAGPGGYTAAFRAADLGKRVVLVERYPVLGGVCLNVGCIPSKALLHVAQMIEHTAAMADWGVSFGKPQIDLDRLRAWKEGVVGRLTSGLKGLAERRKVTIVQGVGRFVSPRELTVETAEGTRRIAFEHAIIAAGSQAIELPGVPHDDPRVIDSTGALALADTPEELLVIGGGIIGLEMATVYHALGSRVTVVELSDGLLPGVDPDLVRPLQKRIAAQYAGIHLGTGVTTIEARDDGLLAHFEGPKAPEAARFDRVLVAVGRRPNGDRISAEQAGVRVSERGFIEVDRQMRTNVEHIFAIGDIVGQPMLAHKASHEGKLAAEVICGLKKAFDARVIPNVAYTDPEVAWVGLTEAEAKQRGIDYGKGSFPWAANGRSLSLGRDEGMTKILFDKESGRVLGAGIVGPHAGDLIPEAALAIEMGADAEDIALTIHPHPTLSETFAMAAEAYEGTLTDLYIPKRR
jgi:dihydrolipoamide dehydrogenase